MIFNDFVLIFYALKKKEKEKEMGAQILILDFSNPHRVKITHTASNIYIPSTNIWLNVP